MIGATVGSYRVLRQIGEGGMGAVYLGEHTMLGRPAAIKILLPALSHDREMVGRFFNEARATTAIRHPGIVEIYDFGFLPDGAAYIAMEMLDGESLASRLRRVGRLPVAAAIDFGRQVAAALHAAHGRGITHRDLKPDNMFLIRDPEIGERVKLLDFGIAKLVSEDGGNRTRTGVVMGTPVYMSPEQCRGTATLDHRADLYSLGCVLYELVTGRPPFVAESAGDIIAHHLYFQPEPVRKHDASVPEPLEQLIMALLAKEPAMRPASAAEVSTILDGWRGGAAASSSNAMHAAPARSAAMMAAAMTPARHPSGVVSMTPTTLSGSAGSVAAPTGARLATGVGGSVAPSRRWLGRAAIGTVVVAAGAIAVVLMTRSPAPPATAAAVTPSVVAATSAPVAAAPAPAPAVVPPPVAPPAAPPPAIDRAAPPPPAAVEPPAPSVAASTPSAGKPAEESRAHKPARVAAAPPAAAPTKKSHDPAAPPREEPKPAAASATPPKPAAIATPPAAPAPPPEAKPAPEVSQKAEVKPAETGDPAKPAASKWGHLMGDKRQDANNIYAFLLQQCKQAATSGDCATARSIAARIADKNVAMYRARVMTDPDIAACLSSK